MQASDTHREQPRPIVVAEKRSPGRAHIRGALTSRAVAPWVVETPQLQGREGVEGVRGHMSSDLDGVA